ncbi:MAG: glycosyltransferase family 4 protein [Armatimonadota bacterium]
MNNFSSVVIVVEGGGPTGGAERVAFETVELLSSHGIPVHIVSSAPEIEPSYLALPGVTGVALNLPVVWEKFFSKNRILSYPLRSGDTSLLPLFRSALDGLDPLCTVVHVHGFHTHFSHLIVSSALNQGFRTHLHSHDYGLVCPNTTFFNFPENRICTLSPLSNECKASPCMDQFDQNLKQFRFRRAESAFYKHRLADRLTSIICPSPFTRTILAKTIGDLPKLRVLRCPVEPASTKQLDPASRTRYIWIGRLTPGKDPDVALRAADEAGVKLTLVGDGPMRAELEKQFSNHEFVGWRSPDDVTIIQQTARCLIMNAGWYETASLVVLECLAAGIPCVIGDHSAATSWVTNGDNGLTFNVQTAGSLTAALEKTKDDGLIRRLGENAFKRYWQDPCSRENYLRDLLEVYNLQ